MTSITTNRVKSAFMLAAIAATAVASVGAQTYTGEVSLYEDAELSELALDADCVLDLNGHDLTFSGATGDFSVTSGAQITNSSDTASAVSITASSGKFDAQFQNVTFGGNLSLYVNGQTTSNAGFQGVTNTHTGGTTLENYTDSNDSKRARINTASPFGTGVLTLKGATLRLVGSNAVTLANSKVVIEGTGNYFAPEKVVTFNDFEMGTDAELELAGKASIDTASDTLTLASGTLTISISSSLSSVGTLTFTGGTLKYGTGITTDLSSKIKNSTAAVKLDTNGTNVTFATAFSDTNTAGLEKLGEGTLTYDVQADLPTITTVSAGTLHMNKCNANWSGTLSVAEDAVVQLTSRHTGNTQLQLTSDASISGEGTIKLDTNGQSGWRMYADLSNFSGTLEYTGTTTPGSLVGITPNATGMESTTFIVSGEPESSTTVCHIERNGNIEVGAFQLLYATADIYAKYKKTFTFGGKTGSESILNGTISGNGLDLVKTGSTPLTIGSGFSAGSGSLAVNAASLLTVNADISEASYTIASGIPLAGSGTVSESQFSKSGTYVATPGGDALTVSGTVDLDATTLEIDLTDFDTSDTSATYTLLNATSISGTPDQSLLSSLNSDTSKGAWKLYTRTGSLCLGYFKHGFVIRIR